SSTEVTARQNKKLRGKGEHQQALESFGETPSLSEAPFSLGEHSSVQDDNLKNMVVARRGSSLTERADQKTQALFWGSHEENPQNP
ncbi:hypothetical protein A2U01_0049748, partial [Trifolium medium]|nr:hypothetical protein [Trifolium medium]